MLGLPATPGHLLETALGSRAARQVRRHHSRASFGMASTHVGMIAKRVAHSPAGVSAGILPATWRSCCRQRGEPRIVSGMMLELRKNGTGCSLLLHRGIEFSAEEYRKRTEVEPQQEDNHGSQGAVYITVVAEVGYVQGEAG